jgi:chorismate synthase
MTNGEILVVRAAMKPISTLLRPLGSVNLATGTEEVAHIERSDVCVVPAAAVVAESAVALVLASALIEKFGGDTLDDVRASVERYSSRAPTKL